MTTDKSSLGLGIMVTHPLMVGESIEVCASHLGGLPFGASVRWCEKHSGTFYKAGLRLYT